MQKAKKFLVLFAIFIVLCLAGGFAFMNWASYSEGYRVGVLAKMAKKGFVFKTWEGELSQGFLDNSTQSDGGAAGVATRIWYFTAKDDPALLSGIDRAIEQNHRVKLFYHERYVSLPWVGVTRNIVYKVEEVQ